MSKINKTYSIAIDKRERDILEILNKCKDSSDFKDINGQTIKWRAEHLTTGDYIIFCNNRAIVVVERKTWPDLAASFRDGRKENINKLLQYREATGSKIAYLIEGQAFPANSTRFSRMPYVNLRAHLDHLLFRDGIIELRSANHIGTIERLFQLTKNISSIKSPIENSIPTNTLIMAQNLTEQTAHRITEPANNITEPTDILTEPAKTALGGKTDLELAQVSQTLNDVQVIDKIWKCLPHINFGNAKLFKNYHISDLLLKKITQEQIANLTYQNGKRIGTGRAKKIYAISNLFQTSNEKYYIKILSAIPGISDTTAKQILSTYSISKILNEWSCIKEELEQLNKGKKRLGKKSVLSIEKFLIKN